MKRTQGDRLALALIQFPHTYGEMQRLGISTSPQKRVAEWLPLHPWARLEKSVRGDLTQWRIVPAPGCRSKMYDFMDSMPGVASAAQRGHPVRDASRWKQLAYLVPVTIQNF